MKLSFKKFCKEFCYDQGSRKADLAYQRYQRCQVESREVIKKLAVRRKK